MAKNDNAHSIRLMNSIRQHIGDAAGDAFGEKFPLSKAADVGKKFEWAHNVSTYLDAHYDPETIKALRKDCRCNDGKSIANKLLKYLKKADSIEDFVKAFNANETFASLVYISDNRIRFCYPECYCACVKRVPGELSKTWCYCTLGNAEGIFKEVFGEGVSVALLESIKSGGKQCVIEVKW